MEFIPADAVDATKLADVNLEVATVSVIWREDSNHPIIDYTGCSGYEAEGLMRGALKRLSRANAKAMKFLEDSLEYEDETEEEDDGED